jgi:hypothetical protein
MKKLACILKVLLFFILVSPLCGNTRVDRLAPDLPAALEVSGYPEDPSTSRIFSLVPEERAAGSFIFDLPPEKRRLFCQISLLSPSHFLIFCD